CRYLLQEALAAMAVQLDQQDRTYYPIQIAASQQSGQLDANVCGEGAIEDQHDPARAIHPILGRAQSADRDCPTRRPGIERRIYELLFPLALCLLQVTGLPFLHLAVPALDERYSYPGSNGGSDQCRMNATEFHGDLLHHPHHPPRCVPS